MTNACLLIKLVSSATSSFHLEVLQIASSGFLANICGVNIDGDRTNYSVIR